MWNEWVALWGIQRRKPRCRRGAGAQQERVVLDRGEKEQGQTGHTVVCAARTQRAEGEGAECDVSGMMSMQICSGETTSRKGQDRGTSAGGAPRRRGGSRGQSCE